MTCASLLRRWAFWRSPRARDAEAVIEHRGILFPAPVLWVLLAQSASAEIRRRYESQGDVFDLILVHREFQQVFLDSYLRANELYFDAIRGDLPVSGGRVLDIGSGIGLLDLMIYRHAGPAKPQLYLLDKSVDVQKLSTERIAPTGFNERYVFTGSMQLASRFLQLNGVAEQDIHPCEVGRWNIPQGAPFDLVFSRKSWGFHYPLGEYLDDVRASLTTQGCLITDVRAGQGGEALIAASFSEVDVLQQGTKSSLVRARMPRNVS